MSDDLLFKPTEQRLIGKYIHNRDLGRSLISIRGVMEKIWAYDAPKIVKNFTDHGEKHSVRVAEFVEQLLQINESVKYSENEIYILLAGVYLHDIGMQCDVAKYPEVKEKAEKLGAKFDVDFCVKAAADYSQKMQDEIRKNHHFLTAAWIDYLFKNKRNNDLRKLSNKIQEIPDKLIEDVIDICKFHSKLPINGCPELFKYSNDRKRMIGALLRFADELDISKDRVDIETIQIFNFDPNNKLYWWLHNNTIIRFSSNKVLIKIRLKSVDLSYGSFICDFYINNFQKKNQTVIDVLHYYNIPVVIDNLSGFIEDSNVDECTSEIKHILDKMQNRENGKVPIPPFEKEPVRITYDFYKNKIGMELVLINAGEFTMGSSENMKDLYPDEVPHHKVTIKKPFYICKYPITQKNWKDLMGKNHSSFSRGDDNKPVENVSRNDVLEFIAKLNESKRSESYRLPTEAEWEYACRAGTTGMYSIDDESNLDEYAWYEENSGGKTHPVGQKKPNAWSLYDMHGNIWECVQDRWHDNYKGTPSDGSAWEDGEDINRRVMRGGSWNSEASSCRSANRHGFKQNSSKKRLGFRLVKEWTGSEKPEF